jgi:hypothetical protein
MSRRKSLWAALLAVPAVVGGGLAYANAQKAKGYICSVTGETLPCEKCCPLNGGLATAATKEADQPKAPEGYVCPLTGEILGCPGCCPLNDKK